MSGRKQHYLPQFLQRPFSHRVVKDNHYVHVHEQTTHYSPSTTGAGAIRGFYSSTQDTRADDNITEAESALGQIIDQIIRTKQLGADRDTAMLFSLLSIRTLKMRNAMSELAPTMLSALRTKASEEAWAEETIEKDINNRVWIDAQIEEKLRSLGRMDRNKRAAMKLALRSQLKKELERKKPKLLNEFNDFAQAAFERLEAEAAKIANDAFLKIFVEKSSLEKRNALFEGFQFTLLETNAEFFVLGDCAVAALDSEGVPRVAMTDINDEVFLNQLFLPVSPRLLIYGTRDSSAAVPGVADINRLSVMLSNHFFISFEKSTPHIEELKPLICTATVPIVSAEELLNF